MKKRLKWIGILGMLSVFILGGLIEISADEYRHRERKRHSGRDDSAKKLGSKQLQPVTNPAYKETCGGCHFAYQPELLPTASWAKLLSGFDDHFGQTLDVHSETLATLTDYLKENGADRSSSRQAAKIMKSLGGGVPNGSLMCRTSTISIMKFLQMSLAESPLARCQIVQHAIGQLRMAFTMMIL